MRSTDSAEVLASIFRQSLWCTRAVMFFCSLVGERGQDTLEVDVCSLLEVSPGVVSGVVFAGNPIVKCSQCVLYSDCLVSVGVVKHDSDWFVVCVNNGLDSSMFFCDVVAISGCVSPLDFHRVWVN